MSKGVVSGGHEATVKAGMQILENGGNAFDAILASLFASFVAEPCMSSPGGGLFILYQTADRRQGLIDGFCQTPGTKRLLNDIDFHRIPIDFGAVTEDFYAGAGAVAVPGAIAAACKLQAKFASMPLRELVAPAVQLAHEGLLIDRFQAYDFKLLEPILRLDLSAAADFFKDGKLKRENDRMRLPLLADFLENLGQEGADLFYKGEIATKIADLCAEKGQLALADLQAYQALERRPLKLQQWGWEILSNPAPSGGGSMILLLQALLANESAEPILHQMAAHLKEVAALRAGGGSLNPSAQDAIDRLSGDHIFNKESLKDGGPSNRSSLSGGSPNNARKWGSTSHINAGDAAGNIISLTSSNGEGSGLWVNGIQLNNMLGEGALFPQGFQSWDVDTRIASLMSPTLAYQPDSNSIYALGSGGASRIPSAIGQVLYALLKENLPLTEAIKKPRMHWQDGKLNCEAGLSASDLPAELQDKRINWGKRDMYFGGVHAIVNRDGRLEGAGDDRRNGCSSLTLSE